MSSRAGFRLAFFATTFLLAAIPAAAPIALGTAQNFGVLGGSADWDVRNRDGHIVGSGVYFYHIEAPSGARRVGRMTIITSR